LAKGDPKHAEPVTRTRRIEANEQVARSWMSGDRRHRMRVRFFLATRFARGRSASLTALLAAGSPWGRPSCSEVKVSG
jgi:hypothetical protein